MKKTSAGFLIAKKFSDGTIKFLGLLALPSIRLEKGGIYDIPKGKISPGESIIQCAIRECEEESGIKIKDSDIVGKPAIRNGLTIFPATTDQEPTISKNPETGKYEHWGYAWLTADEINKSCLGYLRDLVKIQSQVLTKHLDKI